MSGHIHTFFYERDGDTELYVLPAVSALRLDYSELFKVPPPGADEFGRNDAAKLGFVYIEVFEHGHVLHHIRSHGETQGENAPAPSTPLPPRLHPKQDALLPIGVELRDPWARPIDIAYSGVVDAFGRKPARDDYRLLALWETGLSRLRIPFEDIRDPVSRARVEVLSKSGFRFSTFLFRLPSPENRKRLREANTLLEQVNIILPVDEVLGAREELRALREETGLRVFLSPLRSSADHSHSVDGRFAHVIDHGFAPDELDLLDTLGLTAGDDPYVDGNETARPCSQPDGQDGRPEPRGPERQPGRCGSDGCRCAECGNESRRRGNHSRHAERRGSRLFSALRPLRPTHESNEHQRTFPAASRRPDRRYRLTGIPRGWSVSASASSGPAWSRDRG